MMPRVLTKEHKKALNKGRDAYWAKRKQMQSQFLSNSKKSAEIKTVVQKPYVSATIIALTPSNEVVIEHGFSKWDNKPSPPWNEELGKSIAIGRAKKEIKNKYGITLN